MKVGNQGFSGGMLLLALNGFFPAETSKRDSANERTHIPAEASDHASSTTYDFCELKGQYDRTSPATIERELYSKDALDFLAVAFTAVKIAYLQGINFCLLCTQILLSFSKLYSVIFQRVILTYSVI